MATLPSYRTWATSETVTAAMLNSNVRDPGNFWLSLRPTAKLRAATTQSLTTGSGAPILLDAEDYDNDGGHSTVSNTSRYTVVTPGRYLISGLGNHGASTAGATRTSEIRVNSATVIGGTATAGPRPGGTGVMSQPTPTVHLTLAAADIVELYMLQDSGGSLSTVAGSTLTIVWLGS